MMDTESLSSQPTGLRCLTHSSSVAGALLSLALLATGCASSASKTAPDLPRALDDLLSEDSYVQLQPGAFMMGSPEDAEHRAAAKKRGFADDIADRERPQHQVRITKPFQMGKHEVTQEQWEAVMKVNPSAFKGPGLPVTNVSWYDAQEFIKQLQQFDDNHLYRLPTEAEWEYACRAGSSGAFSGQGDAAAQASKSARDQQTTARLNPEAREEMFAAYLQARAWFAGNALNRPHPVGELQPNAWGLYDLHGNVWEWCQDWFEPGYYRHSPPDDPTGPANGAMKINRGGSWQAPASLCRCATRGYDAPTERNQLIGFRLVRVKSENE